LGFFFILWLFFATYLINNYFSTKQYSDYQITVAKDDSNNVYIFRLNKKTGETFIYSPTIPSSNFGIQTWEKIHNVSTMLSAAMKGNP
jgi:hypothetical protein